MPFAIELALDPASDAAVRRIWRELEDVGITYMAHAGAHPHISLGISEVATSISSRQSYSSLGDHSIPDHAAGCLTSPILFSPPRYSEGNPVAACH